MSRNELILETVDDNNNEKKCNEYFIYFFFDSFELHLDSISDNNTSGYAKYELLLFRDRSNINRITLLCNYKK